MKKTFFISALLFASTTIASTDDAWKEHRKQVIETCLKQSGFNKAKAVGDVISFSDNVGYDALLIEGRYPQPHMKNKKGKMLCLFNRKTGVAETSEWH
jgi:hypothetical protein